MTSIQICFVFKTPAAERKFGRKSTPFSSELLLRTGPQPPPRLHVPYRTSVYREDRPISINQVGLRQTPGILNKSEGRILRAVGLSVAVSYTKCRSE